MSAKTAYEMYQSSILKSYLPCIFFNEVRSKVKLIFFQNVRRRPCRVLINYSFLKCIGLYEDNFTLVIAWWISFSWNCFYSRKGWLKLRRVCAEFSDRANYPVYILAVTVRIYSKRFDDLLHNRSLLKYIHRNCMRESWIDAWSMFKRAAKFACILRRMAQAASYHANMLRLLWR